MSRLGHRQLADGTLLRVDVENGRYVGTHYGLWGGRNGTFYRLNTAKGMHVGGTVYVGMTSHKADDYAASRPRPVTNTRYLKSTTFPVHLASHVRPKHPPGALAPGEIRLLTGKNKSLILEMLTPVATPLLVQQLESEPGGG